MSAISNGGTFQERPNRRMVGTDDEPQSKYKKYYTCPLNGSRVVVFVDEANDDVEHFPSDGEGLDGGDDTSDEDADSSHAGSEVSGFTHALHHDSLEQFVCSNLTAAVAAASLISWHHNGAGGTASRTEQCSRL